jgi:hypothetical protein
MEATTGKPETAILNMESVIPATTPETSQSVAEAFVADDLPTLGIQEEHDNEDSGTNARSSISAHEKSTVAGSSSCKLTTPTFAPLVADNFSLAKNFFPLFQLPPELRLKIYELLVVSSNGIGRKARRPSWFPTDSQCMQMLRINKQMRTEAALVLFQKSTF